MSPSIETVAETGSTNADLLQRARAGMAREGMWLRAERQIAGRGRLGRDWQSPADNLYISTLVRLAAGDPPAPTLALVSAVALTGVVQEAGVAAARIKWPNDLMVEGAKAAGVLLEREGDWVVAGFGVNVAFAPDVPGRKTLALRTLAPELDAPMLADALARVFAHWLQTWRTSGLGPVTSMWRSLAHPIGTPLRVALPDGEVFHGTFAALADDGALRLALADGTARVIHAGDVFMV